MYEHWSGNVPKTPSWYGADSDFGPIVPETFLVVDNAVIRKGKCISGVVVTRTTDPLLAFKLVGLRKHRAKCREDMTVLAYSRGTADASCF